MREAESRELEKEWERRRKLAWALRWERRRAKRKNQRSRGTVKLKILGIWVVLFVLICDCFVVNLLDRICSLSGWFVVSLENNNVIFGQRFCLEPMFNWIYQHFCFLVKRMDWLFLIHLKLYIYIYIFFFFFLPLLPFFSKILGPPFHMGALGNCLIRLRVGPALVKSLQ